MVHYIYTRDNATFRLFCLFRVHNNRGVFWNKSEMKISCQNSAKFCFCKNFLGKQTEFKIKLYYCGNTHKTLIKLKKCCICNKFLSIRMFCIEFYSSLLICYGYLLTPSMRSVFKPPKCIRDKINFCRIIECIQLQKIRFETSVKWRKNVITENERRLVKKVYNFVSYEF